MKKYLIFLLLPLFFACGPSDEQIKKDRDSLQTIIDNRDQAIGDFFASFNEIQANLDSIKKMEGILALTTSGNAEMNQNVKDKVNDDVVAIYRILLNNKQNLKKLQSKLKKANMKVAELQKTIESLTKQMEEKDQQIQDLTNKLAQAGLDIQSLNAQIKIMSAGIDSVAQISESKSKVIEEQTVQLNTAFYVIGTTKELKTNNIIIKEGGVLGMGRTSKLSDNFNQDYFTKIDQTKQKSFVLSAKKAVVLTSHPSGSYEIMGDKKRADSLVIKDVKLFWSVSKYLVIEIDN